MPSQSQITHNPLFYLQDSRSYVGNDVLWWAKHGLGYTTCLKDAETYSLEEVVRRHNSRPTDVPWPKDYVDARIRPTVDIQTLKIDDALKNTGITLREHPEPFDGTKFAFPLNVYLNNSDPVTIADLKARLADAQARIDALMFEHCPGEMTTEQILKWGEHQRVANENDQLGC